MIILYSHAADVSINLDTVSCTDLRSQGANLEMVLAHLLHMWLVLINDNMKYVS